MSRRGRQSRVPVEERLRVVLGPLSGGLNVSEAAGRHKVMNQTVANWRNRFLEAGKAGLENTLPGQSTNGDLGRAAVALGERSARARVG